MNTTTHSKRPLSWPLIVGFARIARPVLTLTICGAA
ncbi:hypothetical protein SAMN04489752_3362 [Brevibacterium siliguriense]|uniref:Uncharacterized protein n=1 Tax=Brevibacterium siliguriense TaxID=1136497 RepID=A0A1H1XLQ2_9MICO|nr:hypothetical protein SAMN04489752_3362 [Brevibacterium siliguriense]